MQLENEKKIQVDEINKLYWACRRGMLELDVLLGNFFKEAYPYLAVADKNLFIRLLGAADTQLFAWLMGHETPEIPELIPMIKAIQHHARTRIYS